MKIKIQGSLPPGGGQLVSACVMLVLGLVVIFGTKDYIPRTYEEVSAVGTPSDALPVSTPSDAEEPDGVDMEGEEETATTTPAQAEPVHLDSSVRLNMAFVYPEGDDGTDAWNSYAGQACELLSEMDSSWISEMYGKLNTAPELIAEELGIGRNAILGLYNPSVETQSQDDPDSWVIPSWSKSQVTFSDGDGTAIDGYSNGKDIVSMASVYAYRQGITDGDAFVEYCRQLWELSHQYTVQIGEVYYCDGACLLEHEETPSPSDLGTDLPEATVTGFAETSAVPDTDGTDVGQTVPETSASETTFAAETSAADMETQEEIDYHDIRSHYTLGDVPVDWETYEGPAREVWEQVIAAYGGELPKVQYGIGSDEEVVCPGHLDLEISAVILGMTGVRNLFDADVIGNGGAISPGNAESESDWQGWTKLNRHHARCIEHQNWESAYRLPVVTTLYMGNPLSADDISTYMDMLPEDITVFQREVICQALQSVGCIPYYWGGKPSCAGYDGNGFGSMTVEDESGRRLRGLDCSGWINWVYWTALGNRLEYEGTSGLVQLGTAVDRTQLQPGDIIVRTGTENSHVYLFLAWAPDDEMYVIHETSGVINNVTVSKMDVSATHYRRLLNR